MVAKTADRLWKAYPGSHLHCEVTQAGLDSYKVVMSLFNKFEELIGTIEHYGSGDLPTVKEAAFEKLVKSLSLEVE